MTYFVVQLVMGFGSMPVYKIGECKAMLKGDTVKMQPSPNMKSIR